MTRKKQYCGKDSKAYKIREILKEVREIMTDIETREQTNSITIQEIAQKLGFKSTYKKSDKSENVFFIKFNKNGISRKCFELLLSDSRIQPCSSEEALLGSVSIVIKPEESQIETLINKIISDIKLEILGYLDEELDMYFNFENDEDIMCFCELTPKSPEVSNKTQFFNHFGFVKDAFAKRMSYFEQLSIEKSICMVHFLNFYNVIIKKENSLKNIDDLFKFPYIDGTAFPKKTPKTKNQKQTELDRFRNDIIENSKFMQWLSAIYPIETNFINKSRCLSVYNRHTYWVDRVLIFKKQQQELDKITYTEKKLKYLMCQHDMPTLPKLHTSAYLKNDSSLKENITTANIQETNADLIDNGVHLVSRIDYLCTKVFLIEHFVSNFIIAENKVSLINIEGKYDPFNEQNLLYWLINFINDIIFYLGKYIKDIITKFIPKENLNDLYQCILKEEPLDGKYFEYLSERESFFMKEDIIDEENDEKLRSFFKIHKNIYNILYKYPDFLTKISDFKICLDAIAELKQPKQDEHK